jgi:hypothetical protein
MRGKEMPRPSEGVAHRLVAGDEHRDRLVHQAGLVETTTAGLALREGAQEGFVPAVAGGVPEPTRHELPEQRSVPAVDPIDARRNPVWYGQQRMENVLDVSAAPDDRLLEALLVRGGSLRSRIRMMTRRATAAISSARSSSCPGRQERTCSAAVSTIVAT